MMTTMMMTIIKSWLHVPLPCMLSGFYAVMAYPLRN